MASLRTIRGRIKSVKNTQKITKAMKMVATAKLRRAQDAAVRARPYAELIDDMLSRLAASSEAHHPLLDKRHRPRGQGVRRVEVLILTSDRGLCGGFNSNIVRKLQRFLVDSADQYDAITVSTIGRRGREFAKKRGIEVRRDHAGILGKLVYKHAQTVSDDLVEQFTSGHLDAVYLLYNKFQSAMVQKVTLTQLLPIRPSEAATEKAAAAGSDFLFEPSKDELLKALLPKHLAMQIWRAMLESEASEHGARMAAMDSATKNAKEMIARLTLQYNRARQAAITKELMEIVSGAEALK
jgi:F-type H+-transporting ATPase subunit gamma